MVHDWGRFVAYLALCLNLLAVDNSRLETSWFVHTSEIGADAVVACKLAASGNQAPVQRVASEMRQVREFVAIGVAAPLADARGAHWPDCSGLRLPIDLLAVSVGA